MEELRELASEIRRSTGVLDPILLLKAARAQGLGVDRDDLARLLRQGATPQFICPSFVPAFLSSYVRVRGSPSETAVDLWAAAGWMLPPLVEALGPRRATGILADRRELELAELLHPEAPIQWEVADPQAFLDRTAPGLSLVIGTPPWRWQPRAIMVTTEDGPVTLRDDPANVSILKACTLLAEDGLGFFVVGPGFVMRPGPETVFASFRRFGLHLEGLIELPRGIFSPDTGTGRLLVVIARREPPDPVIGRLTSDQGDTTVPLEKAGGMS